ncbi:hypothetical protein KPL37_19115 [Clostridium frigoris]|uniref:Uncharacterized protein n=1 Tax=Clostridium frigoris TaxID=205327 RepID=A0ABS6BYW8_9CLOT|nr:hypothetical protein [Clostridium frigoris]
MNELVENMLNDISKGKSPNQIIELHSITNRELKCNSKSPSEVINISASKMMNSCTGDDSMRIKKRRSKLWFLMHQTSLVN